MCKGGQREVMFLLKTIHSCEKEAGEFLQEIAASWQKGGLAFVSNAVMKGRNLFSMACDGADCGVCWQRKCS